MEYIQPCLLPSSPSERRQTCQSRAPPVRSTLWYHVLKKSYSTGSLQNKTRTPEEPSASTNTTPWRGSLHVTCRNAKFLSIGRPARRCCYTRREIHMTSAAITQSCLLSVVYKLFTRAFLYILNRIEKVFNERQLCEQAGFRKGFSTIDHIHTVSKLIEVSREYKMPVCLTFTDLKRPSTQLGGHGIFPDVPSCTE
ncbi:hypothetical protein RB195_011884 [Necator americanus]|uniref:Reverse transcriptase domain-containing protein n=1 Tax=Necator americanus TaxID=51031 RepID=A0ABR1D4I7_NECAM